MKKVIAWLLVLALTAAISIGATLAYLTDTDEDVNVMTVGKVKIDQLEYERIDDETSNKDAQVQVFHDNKPLYPAITDKEFDYTPGDTYVDWEQIGKDGYTSEIWNPENINNELDKMVFVKNKGTYDAYVRTVFAFEAGKYTTIDEFKSMMHLNLNETEWTWQWLDAPVAIPNDEGTTTNYFIAVATYNEKLAPGAITEISLSQIALDKSATNEDVEAFGDTYQILVKSQGIQADGFTDAEAALGVGFGAVNAQNIPWDNDNAITDITMKTALHNLEGKTDAPITSKVSSVVFGLNKNYASIADQYDGTLVDVEQDVPVYAYYVPNGSLYDVYFLADDVIYAPEDSSYLLGSMSALTRVDTANLDTSRAVMMNRMFYNCGKLEEVDVSKWDTSNATTLNGIFFNCPKIQALDVSKWDTSNVTDLYATFYNCASLTQLDVSKWDVSNVTNMAFTFDGCRQIEYYPFENWDVGKVEIFDSFLSSASSNSGDMKVKSVDMSKWDMSSAVTISHMFYGCGYLTELDLSAWDVSNVQIMDHLFADCHRLAKIDFTGWNTASLVNPDAMFNDCEALVTIDVSDFDMSKADNVAQMFESCGKLERIIGMENWDVSNVTNFQQAFQGSNKLVEVDLSGWDTSSGTDFRVMFSGCSGLTTVYVGDGWDVSKATKSDNMFSGCGKLTGANGTTTAGNPTNVTYARVDQPAVKDAEGNVITEAVPGYLTYKAPVNN